MLWPFTSRGSHTRHRAILAACLIASASSVVLAAQSRPAQPAEIPSILEAHNADISPERAHNKTPENDSGNTTHLPLARARYFSNGVYLGAYPGFMAPGHRLSTTSFLPEGADLHIHFNAQPYQGQMPSATLLINGQFIAELHSENGEPLKTAIPRPFTGKLAEIAIEFAGYQPAGGTIKLDTVRTPINIPLLRIHALEVVAPDSDLRLTNDL